jgi:hypothetical protein
MVSHGPNAFDFAGTDRPGFPGDLAAVADIERPTRGRDGFNCRGVDATDRRFRVVDVRA